MEFCERLKELRQSHKLTQVQMAKIIGMKERQYQNLESGKSRTSFDKLIAIADYFDVSLDYLTGRDKYLS